MIKGIPILIGIRVSTYKIKIKEIQKIKSLLVSFPSKSSYLAIVERKGFGKSFENRE
jgi:hypothetical protein